jgi:subtilisin family serine protease
MGADQSAVLTQLQATAGVASAEPEQQVQLPEAQQSSIGFYEGWLADSQYAGQYSLTLIQAAAAQRISSGQGITVALLDTGVTASHPALSGHLLPGYNVLDPLSSPADLPSAADSDADSEPNDAVGHGTAVAGIVAAVAPQAHLLPIKVLDSEGLGSVYGVAEGIRYAVDHGAQVINLSLGMPAYSPAVGAALAYAAGHEVVVVSAAGNTGLTTPTYPAGDPNVLAVAATDSQDHKAPFSAYGPFASVSAPGISIISAYYSGGYAVWSGTSMAAPFVSGEAALISADTALTEGETSAAFVRERICESAVQIDNINPPFAGGLGAGRIDLLQALTDN